MTAPAVWAIVVAAGEGRRFGAQKQFEPLAGRIVVEWSIEACRSVAQQVVLVLPASRLADERLCALADEVTVGGASRAESVRAGLSVVPESASIVVVHDAARPLASPALFHSVLAALEPGVAGAVPGLALSDTVKRVRAGYVLETLPREELVAVQTPQAFRADELRAAHAAGGEATDDAALLEALGQTVRVVAGEEANIKLTTPADLERAAQSLALRVDQ